MSDLYDTDFLQWTERQTDLLRRRAAGELVNDAEFDWLNVAEEIEDVGRSQLRAVKSHLVQALLHDLKAEARPLSSKVPHWRAGIAMTQGRRLPRRWSRGSTWRSCIAGRCVGCPRRLTTFRHCRCRRPTP